MVPLPRVRLHASSYEREMRWTYPGKPERLIHES
jgi:hypothetical protein